MNQKLKILLFAHPRSGSTSLLKALNTHPDVNLMHEPFNSDRENWGPNNINYLKSVHDKESLVEMLNEIHKKCNGFKHLSYQLAPELNEYMLKSAEYQTIFLFRKNLLKSVVSSLIAEQNKIWTSEEKRNSDKQNIVLAPLSSTAVGEQLEYLFDETAHYRDFLVGNDIPHYSISYEDLFEGGDASRYKKLAQLLVFLNLIPSGVTDEMKTFLAPDRRINTLDNYRSIPNINELEKKFGNEKTGFLFA